jgi:hypothetical protein
MPLHYESTLPAMDIMKSPESTLTSSRATARFLLPASILLLYLSAGRPASAIAQDTRRAQATRAELQASLAELEQYSASSGYSGRLRGEKRREADLIRRRLQDGDLQVGDQIELTVTGEQSLTNTFTVVSGRMLSLPGLPDIPLKGVLRAEAQDYLTAQIGKYLKDPAVRVRTRIRLSVFGSVVKPGFYQVPADELATDAFMAAGGPAGMADPNKAFVRRGNQEIWPAEALREAIRQGLTLDQLNLRAGDELYLDPKKQGHGFNPFTIFYTLSAVTSAIYLIARIF